MNLELKVKDILVEGRWDFSQLEEPLTVRNRERVCGSQVVLSEGPEFVVWKPNPSGEFTVATAYELIRPKRQEANYLRQLGYGYPVENFIFWVEGPQSSAPI